MGTRKHTHIGPRLTAEWCAHGRRATHKGSFKEEFGIDVECYVLGDEQKTAVISQRGMGTALGLAASGNALPRLLAGLTISKHVGPELREKFSKPLIFQWYSAESATSVYGYDVTILIDVCKAILSANAESQLGQRYANVVRQAQIILNASAKAGIKNLVYALAGYDATREEIISAYRFCVLEELAFESMVPPAPDQEVQRLAARVASLEANRPEFALLNILPDQELRLRVPLGVSIERNANEGIDSFTARWDETQLFAEDSTVHEALSGLAEEIVAAYRDILDDVNAGTKLGGYVQSLWSVLDRAVEMVDAAAAK